MADPTGTQILPPNAERALEYSRVNPKDQPVKYLYPDGSVWSGLPVFGAGGSGGGGLTDAELRATPLVVGNGFYIPYFDTKVIDESLAPATTTITYKKDGSTVATKTITIDGTSTTIAVVLA